MAALPNITGQEPQGGVQNPQDNASLQNKLKGIEDSRASELLSKLNNNSNRQDQIIAKIKNNQDLDLKDIMDYKLTETDKEIVDALGVIFSGGKLPDNINPKDFLSIAQAKVLVPRVIIDVARKAADPVYLCSKFYKPVTFKGQEAIIRFPIFGVIKAEDIPEGAEYPEKSGDWNLMEKTFVDIKKSGVRIQLTEELLNQCEFDILSLLVSECGRALARWREEKVFYEFFRHSHKVFDNSMRTKFPELGTHGVNYDNTPNDTMSIEDLLDLIIALYNNLYTPTDLIMHPLIWTVFARNGLTGSYSAPLDKNAKAEMPNGSFKLGPESVQGRLPFAFNVDLSPFAPLNKLKKTFNIYAVDKDNVGTCLERSKMATDKFVDPSRDIMNVKFMEAYGFATFNNGRAIASANNISMAKSYPLADRVFQIK